MINHNSKPIFSLILLLLITSLSASSAGQSRRDVTHQSTRHEVAPEAYLAESVDIQPQFPGGEVALMRYINAERRYPASAYEARVQGRVLCSFVVGEDGRISNVEVLRGVDESLNREAVRVIQNMPRWQAGRIGSSNVPVFCILPIPFRL